MDVEGNKICDSALENPVKKKVVWSQPGELFMLLRQKREKAWLVSPFPVFGVPIHNTWNG